MSRKVTRTWLTGIVLVLLALALSGCFGGAGSRAALTGSSWPGITMKNDVIYIAAGQQVLSIDPDTGARNWAFPAEPDNDLSFYARPAVNDDIIVVTDYSENLHVLNPDGQELWAFLSEARFIGGAVISDGLIYAGTVDGTLYAIDRETREAAWTFAAERDIWSTPVLGDNGTLYVTSLDKHLYALDGQTGDFLWKFPADNNPEYTPENVGALAGTPTYHEGMLYFGGFGNKVFALDTETQNVEWVYETSNWVWGSPAIDEESGLLVGGDLDGHVYALDIENGEEVWTFDTDGPVVGTPALGDHEEGRVAYVSSADTNLYAIKLSDGTLATAPVTLTAEFNAFLSGTNEQAIPIYAPPVLYADKVLIGAHEGPCPLFEFDSDSLLGKCLYETPDS